MALKTLTQETDLVQRHTVLKYVDVVV